MAASHPTLRLARRIRSLRGEEGAAAVEFALVGTALIALSLGIIEFGRALQAKNGLDYATTIGARMVLIGKTDDQIKTKIKNDFKDQVGSGTITVTISAATAIDGVSYREVKTSLSFQSFVPFASGVWTLSSASKVPIVPTS